MQCADACKESAALRAELELVARSIAEQRTLPPPSSDPLANMGSSGGIRASSNASAGSLCASIGSASASIGNGTINIVGAGQSATGINIASGSSAPTASLVAQARASIFSNQAPRQHEQQLAESRTASRSSSVDLFMPRRVTPPACDLHGVDPVSVPGQAPASAASLTANVNTNTMQSTPASAAYRFVPTLQASTATQSNTSAVPLPSLVAVAPALPWPALDPPRRVPLTLAPANSGPAHTPGGVDSDGGGGNAHSASCSDDWVRAYSSRRASNGGADDALAHSLVQRYRASSVSAASVDAQSDLGRSASAHASSGPATASFAPARSHAHSHSSVPPGFMLVGDLHLGDVLLVQASASSSSAVAVAQATSRVFAADTTLRGHASSVHACIVIAIDRASDGAGRSGTVGQMWRNQSTSNMTNIPSHCAFQRSWQACWIRAVPLFIFAVYRKLF